MNEPSYEEQSKNNEAIFKDQLKAVRPDIWLLMDIVDQTGVNPFVLWKIARAMHNVSQSTKYGQVVVEIENDTVRFVRGTSADKINQPVILDKS